MTLLVMSYLVYFSAFVNFLTHPHEGRSKLRPADVMVYGWVGEKHACVDFIKGSPLVGLRTWGFIVEQATLKATLSIMVKHEKTCLDNQHVFIPFSICIFGYLAPEAVYLLQRVQRRVHTILYLLAQWMKFLKRIILSPKKK